MRRLLPILSLTLFPALADETLRLAVGQQHVLPGSKVVRLSVADPGIAEAAMVAEGDRERRQILLTGMKPGRTDLLIWEAEGAVPKRIVVEVVEFNPDRFAAEIRELTEGIEGLVIRAVGDKVVLDGRLLSARDKERVDLIAKAYPQILNLTKVDLGGAGAAVAEEIRKRVRSGDLTVEAAGARAILRGTVPSEADRTAAEQIAQAFYGEVTNQLVVAAEMVEVHVTFARVQASDLRKAGQNLPADLAGVLTGATRTGGGGPVYAASAKLPVVLNALKGEGKATVLAEPRLSTASGSEASFHSGGEQGFRVSGTGAADMKFRKYGLLLRVKPALLPDGRIRTWLSIEVSAPAAGGGADAAFTTFTTESEVVAGDAEAVVVSGLAESLRSRFRDKTPILGDIPVLKSLFGASGRADDETRLLLVVTPRRAAGKAADPEGARILDDARKGP